MSDIIAVPTVEQINLEHRLAHSKAGEAVQHATNCGLMLLQIKAGLAHGAWLPWLKQQQESGLIEFSDSTAKRYMRVAANRSRMTDLEAPSIRAALELFSDKEPAEQQGELIDVEAERKAREEAEAKAEAERQAREIAERRAREFGEESNERRKRIRALEEENDSLKARPAPETIRAVEVVPADYEPLKAKAAQLESELAATKAEQTRIIQSAIKAKMSGYQGELDAIEARKRATEEHPAALRWTKVSDSSPHARAGAPVANRFGGKSAMFPPRARGSTRVDAKADLDAKVPPTRAREHPDLSA